MQTINELLKSKTPAWCAGTGKDNDVVVSTRVRLARNFAAERFPVKQDDEEAMRVWKRVLDFTQAHPSYSFYRLDTTSQSEKDGLVASHLISPEHGREDERKRAVVLNEDLSQSIMVNEEDHLRMQVFRSGLDLGDAWQEASALDDKLAQHGDYAFTNAFGYLSSCPTNLGTGLRASVMLHLPVLAQSNKRGALQQVGKMGLTLRGFQGEGSEATGNLYQLSNQVTLGRSEEDILAGLGAATKQIVGLERALREALLKNKTALSDQCCRALGNLAYARRLTSKEAYALLSTVRLGVSLSLVEGLSLETIDALLIKVHPGYVSFEKGAPLNEEERDIHRANLVRKELLPH